MLCYYSFRRRRTNAFRELDQVYFVSLLQPSKRKLLDKDVCYLGLGRRWF